MPMRALRIVIVAVIAGFAMGVAFAQAPSGSAAVPPQGRGATMTPEQRAAAAAAQTAKLLAMERPIEAMDTVWTDEMTWLEVRDALKAGKTTVLIPSGGIEQNGPYLATGKHNYVNRASCGAVARKLGNALCAPVVPFAPDGDIERKTDHMAYPGTISLRLETYRAVLTDMAASLRAHGFEHIVLMGDNGGESVDGMKQVTQELGAKWAGGKTSIHFVPEYYEYAPYQPKLRKYANDTFGWKPVNEGHHDNPAITVIMMTVDPNTVRVQQRIKANKASIDAISIVPVDRAVAAGRKLVEYRAEQVAAAIRKVIASPSTTARR